MTDIIAAPDLRVTRPKPFGLRLPKLRFPKFLASAFVSIGGAFELAYVAPFERPDGRIDHREAETADRNPDW